MLLGVIADDFTGAGDIANTLARGGMSTMLFIGANATQTGDCEAGVVALKSRSITAREAVAQSLTALERLRALGCRQIVFKYCSTFDSTPSGNIGPVAEALAEALGARGVVVCPAFPATGRTIYQGHLFVGDKLLSESGMARHPLNPMTDPDIRRWLAQQCARPPGHIAYSVVREGAEAIRRALEAESGLVVVDALSEGDLRAIGAAVKNAGLVTGGSGVALGLPGNFHRAGLPGQADSSFVGNDRPAVLLAGSCSAATREQVKRRKAASPALEIDIRALLGGEYVAERATNFLAAHRDEAPLVYSTAAPEYVADAQRAHGVELAAKAVESFFGELASRAVALGFGRIVVAGGETSGAVVSALGLDALDVGPEIAPGVPALSARPLALALKSGNFGGPDFFEDAVRALRAA